MYILKCIYYLKNNDHFIIIYYPKQEVNHHKQKLN